MDRECTECTECGDSFDPRWKKRGGLAIHCDECSLETTSKVVGSMHFDHKTAPALEIKRKDGTLLKAAAFGEKRR